MAVTQRREQDNEHESNIAIDLARISYGLGTLDEKFDAFEKSNDEFHKSMQRDMNDLRDAANRWKGGFIVVLALGGLVSWLASIGANISKLWH